MTLGRIGGDMPRHTKMPERKQCTPFGDVKINSRWVRNKYYLVAVGTLESLKWMFPGKYVNPEKHGNLYRTLFSPSARAITIERELRKLCKKWQDNWNERLDDYEVCSSGESNLTTLRKVVDYLKVLREPRLKANTHSVDCQCLKYWEVEIDFDMPLENLNAQVLQEGFENICYKLKPSSANRVLGVMKTYLNMAIAEEILFHAPHKRLKKVKVYKSHRSIKWWTKGEVETVLMCAREIDKEITNYRKDRDFHTGELLIGLGCYLGLRLEEVIMQRWQDLDLDSVDVRTGRPTPVCHVVPNGGWEPKDGEARTIPIRNELLIILESYRKESGYILEPEIRQPKRGGSKRVYRYDPKKLWNRILKIAIERGVKRITPYGMRHTFASNLVSSGISDIKISRWMGHANTRMLHLHYAHLRAFDDDINC